jgi:hypothetical protein
MRIYTTLKTIEVHQGIIGLTTSQAGPRGNCLFPVCPGVYQIVNPVCFKKGEEIGFESVDKALAPSLRLKRGRKKADK